MVREVSTVDFRRNPGDMLSQVQSRNDSFLISEDGKTVAALVDAHVYEQILRMNQRFDEISAKMAEAYKDIPEEIGMAEIDEAVARVRHR